MSIVSACTAAVVAMLVLVGSSSASGEPGRASQNRHAPHWLALSSYEGDGADGGTFAPDGGDEQLGDLGAPKRDAEAPARVLPPATPQNIARAMVRDRGWSTSQWVCLEKLWNHESHFRVNATNAKSGAYGIPQALPAEKMAVAGDDWRTNPSTQILWGLDYITDRYETPCGAWKFWRHHIWY